MMNRHAMMRGAAGLLVSFAASAVSAQTERGSALFAQQCRVCHAEGGGQGPSLAGVLGRPAGSGTFSYTPALQHSGLTWTPATLDRFLANPQSTVPGTTMAVQVVDPAERRALIAYMATLQPTASQAASPGAETGGGDWRADRPGLRHRVAIVDLPPPYATRSAGNGPRVVPRPAGRMPAAPQGFHVSLFADGLTSPRIVRVAPNGDVFVAETAAGRIRVLRAALGAEHAAAKEVFATGLTGPFGMAFYPPGPNPQFLYVAETNRVVRFPYRPGDLAASGAPEVVVPQLARTTGGHSTRDLAFSPDGARMFVSIGSGSNVAESMGPGRPDPADAVLGAAWGYEEGRADVLAFTPDGRNRQVFATGLRNCVGLAVQPLTGALWCSTNERDGLGDDLVPDYVTRVREGGFYGWPWYYLGDHEEPRLRGARPDLRGRVDMPDVLLQAHSASLGMVFYDAAAFPPSFRGAFAAEHGSWDRSKRTGYKVIRLPLDANGAPIGEYEDFLTGFVVDDNGVWGRPVAVAVAADGALLVTEDGSGTMWRVAYTGG